MGGGQVGRAGLPSSMCERGSRPGSERVVRASIAAVRGPSRTRWPPWRQAEPGAVMQPVLGLVMGVLSRLGSRDFEQPHEGDDFGDGGGGADRQGHQDVAAAAGGPVGDGDAAGLGDPAQGAAEIGVDGVLAVVFGVEIQSQQGGAATVVERDRGRVLGQAAGEGAGSVELVGVGVADPDRGPGGDAVRQALSRWPQGWRAVAGSAAVSGMVSRPCSTARTRWRRGCGRGCRGRPSGAGATAWR